MSTETILCVETSLIRQHIAPKGFLPKSLIDPKFVLNDDFAFFAPRESIEQRKDFRQVIPYVILRYKQSIALYKRTSHGTEHRLYHLSSIGFGGHVGLKDAVLIKDGVLDVKATVEKAAFREMGEEIEYANITSKELIGIIFDEYDLVSSVHLGIVEIWDVEIPFIKPRENAISECRFIPLNEVPVNEKFERWSYLCLTYLQKDG